jgi:hypothetical protein
MGRARIRVDAELDLLTLHRLNTLSVGAIVRSTCAGHPTGAGIRLAEIPLRHRDFAERLCRLVENAEIVAAYKTTGLWGPPYGDCWMVCLDPRPDPPMGGGPAWFVRAVERLEVIFRGRLRTPVRRDCRALRRAIEHAEAV